MSHLKNLENIATQVLDLAKQEGATAAEVAVNNSNGFSVQVRLGEVETLEHHRDKSINITVYFDKQKGSTSVSATEPENLAEAVKAACHIARYTSPDEFAGLADKNLLAFKYPNLD